LTHLSLDSCDHFVLRIWGTGYCYDGDIFAHLHDIWAREQNEIGLAFIFMKLAFLANPRFSLGVAPSVSSTPSAPILAHNSAENDHKRMISCGCRDARSHPGTTHHVATLVGPPGRLDLPDSTYTADYQADILNARRPLNVSHVSDSFRSRS
jgi:hypothetical protein